MSNQSILSYIQKPSRYLGSEINSVRKDLSTVQLHIALAFPDLYDIGTSHFGIQILYHLLNRRQGWAAERVFAPAKDMEMVLRERQTPLHSLESRTPIHAFDIVGFSLLYELNFTNVINMIDLSGIPLTWRERQDIHPLIIAGGPCVCNPEPMADFFDAMVFGDGESIVIEMAQAWIEWKNSGKMDRIELLRSWSGLEGVYVPRFYAPEYDNNGIQRLTVSRGAPEKISRNIIPDLDKADFPDSPIIPYGKPIHDRLRLEISRGCSRGCRFCQAGMIYRPVRERSPGNICGLVRKALQQTGYEDISLLSLSTGDYTCLSGLMESLMRQCHSDRVAISLPSLRAGSLTPRLMELIRSVRKTGFTIAPEAGSQRLRDVINKNITFNDVAETVRNAFELGWNVIKLYFMVGLPTENSEDLDGIVDMVRDLKKIKGPSRRKPQINVSLTTFIPKAHTPFQWCEQISLKQSKAKIAYLREKLNIPGVHVKWQHPEMSLIEGVLARGDQRIGPAIVQAWKNGATFDGWNDQFEFGAWIKAFRQCGLDPEWFTTRRRREEEPLPWQHIDTRIDPGFFKQEWRDAMAGKVVQDCRYGDCQGCGICDFSSLQPIVFEEFPDLEKPGWETEASDDEKYIWLSLAYRKIGSARFFGHLELSHIFSRAIRRAGIKVKYSQGFHPMPRISFDDPLPLGMESEGEYMRLLVAQRHSCGDVKDSINACLPEGLEIFACGLKSEISKANKVDETVFSVDLQYVMFDENQLTLFHSSEAWPYTRKSRKGSIHRINLKEAVKRMYIEKDNTLYIAIRTGLNHTVRPTDLLISVFNFTQEQINAVRIYKRVAAAS